MSSSSALSPGGYVRQGQRGVSPPRSVNVQVAVRCRPINDRERTAGERAVVQCLPDRREVVCAPPANQRKGAHSAPNPKKTFTYDHVFGPDATQADVYHGIVEPIVDEVLQGYNCTVFAYGQTGTGKTHTMEGRRDAEMTGVEERRLAENAGIIPRAVKQVFDHLRSITDEHSVRVSHLELYNEQLTDLLGPEDVTGESLRMYEDPHKGTFVQGLEDIVVRSEQEIFAVLDRSAVKRRTAETLMNKYSSRSHSVFSITIHIKESTPEGADLLKVGKLNLVDLAGSENVGRSGAVKGRAREAGNINQSLLTLGRVITALVDRHPHVPYRDSKLTRLLQESLGGRNKTCVIATVTPGSNSLEETASTLDYAYRAKSIKNRPTVNQMIAKHVLLKEYTEEIQKLKKELDANRSKNGVYLPPEEYERLQQLSNQQKDTISHLENRNEEFEKKTQVLKEKLDRTQDALAREQKELFSTRDVLSGVRQELSTTRKELNTTRQQKEENAHLIRSHVATESTLQRQGQALQDRLSLGVSDIRALHNRVDVKFQLEKENVGNLSVLQETVNQNAATFRDALQTHESEQNARLQTCGSTLSKMLSGLDASIASILAKMRAFSEHFDNLETEHSTARTDVMNQFHNTFKEQTACARGKLSGHCDSVLATKDKVLSLGEAVFSAVEETRKSVDDIKTAVTEYHSNHQTNLKEFAEDMDITFTALNSELSNRVSKQAEVLAEMQSTSAAHFEAQKKLVQETKENIMKQLTNSLDSFLTESHTNLNDAKESFDRNANLLSTESTAAQNSTQASTRHVTTKYEELSQKSTKDMACLHDNIDSSVTAICKQNESKRANAEQINSSIVDISQQASDWLADMNEDLNSSELSHIRFHEDLNRLHEAQGEARRTKGKNDAEELAQMNHALTESTGSSVSDVQEQLDACRKHECTFVQNAKESRIPSLQAPVESFSIRCDLDHDETPAVREWPAVEMLARTENHAKLVEDMRQAKGQDAVALEDFGHDVRAEVEVVELASSSESSCSSSQENKEPISNARVEESSVLGTPDEKCDDTGSRTVSSASEALDGMDEAGVIFCDTTNRGVSRRIRRGEEIGFKKRSGIPAPRIRGKHRLTK